jgi:hypothetical protein
MDGELDAFYVNMSFENVLFIQRARLVVMNIAG